MCMWAPVAKAAVTTSAAPRTPLSGTRQLAHVSEGGGLQLGGQARNRQVLVGRALLAVPQEHADAQRTVVQFPAQPVDDSRVLSPS